jgi:hypothetical protein
MLPRLLVSICHRRVGPVLAQLVLEKFSQVLWIKSIKAFLDEDQMERGYALLCVSYPTSNCTIKSDIQNDLN